MDRISQNNVDDLMKLNGCGGFVYEFGRNRSRPVVGAVSRVSTSIGETSIVNYACLYTYMFNGTPLGNLIWPLK